MFLTAGALSWAFFYNWNLVPALLACALMSSVQYFTFGSIQITSWSSVMSLQDLNWGMIMLSIWVIMMSLLTKPQAGEAQRAYVSVMLFLLLILIYTFCTPNILMFYFSFEFSLLPIIAMILGWGYQPERINAAISMTLYTVFASLPLLLFILLLTHQMQSNNWMLLEMPLALLGGSKTTSLLSIMAMGAFLVKYPMYGAHLWLPRAHVEAPVEGSMILAAILLKLGGYGLYRAQLVFYFNQSMNLWLLYFSLLGAAWISMLSVWELDMKTIVAYSSVAHMGMAISATLALTHVALFGMYYMLIAHGICSSVLFYLVNEIYQTSHSRNLMLANKLLTRAPLLMIAWMLACAINAAVPPSLNFFSEVYMIISLVNTNFTTIAAMLILLVFPTAYSLNLYATSQQGQPGMDTSFNVSSLTLNSSGLALTHVIILFLLVLMAQTLIT